MCCQSINFNAIISSLRSPFKALPKYSCIVRKSVFLPGETELRCRAAPILRPARPRVAGPTRIDNLQNYCLGMRYGARSRSRLCRRLSTSLVRHRLGLEKFLENRFILIRRSFNPRDLLADLLRVQDPFFSGKKVDLLDRN